MLRFSGRIPITIHPTFLFIAFVIGWLNTQHLVRSSVWMVVIVLSVLVHELGHALTARGCGQEAEIELAGLGGVTYRKGKKLSLGREFLVVLCGPLAGLSLCAVAFTLLSTLPLEGYAADAVAATFAINLIWSLLNLIPVLPLDGGHLVRIPLEGRYGVRGLKLSIMVGIFVGISASLFFFLIGQVLAGAFFFLVVFEGVRSLRGASQMTGADRDETLNEVLQEGERAFGLQQFDLAVEKFQEVREKNPDGLSGRAATVYIAMILSECGEEREAFDLLYPLKSHLSPQALKLLHRLAFRLGEYETVQGLANECFQHSPEAEVALTNALVYATQGQVRPAVGWLECAAREGLELSQEVLGRKEFDAIRSQPHFQALEKGGAW